MTRARDRPRSRSASLSLRSGDLGAFLRSVGIGEKQEDTFGNAASWNERLIDAYIGGRIFLDNPIVGTGWHGELPPERVRRASSPTRARASPTSRDATSRRGRRVHPAADVRPGAVRARDRRRAALPRRSAFVTVRTACAWRRRWPRGDPDEAAALPAGGLGRRARGRARAVRRSSAASRSPPSSGSRSASTAVAPSRRSHRPRTRSRHEDRARDRAAQRRRRRAARAPARRTSRRGEATTWSSSPGRSPPARSRWSTSPTSSACALHRLPVLQRELSPRADSAAILALRRIIRERRPNVLHTHTAKAGATGRLAALISGRARPARDRAHLPRPRPQRVLQPALGARLPSDRANARVRVRERSSPSARRCATISSASASRRAERFAVVPYGFDLPAWNDADDRVTPGASAARSEPATRRSSSAGPAG